jgi:hypothetical protein
MEEDAGGDTMTSWNKRIGIPDGNEGWKLRVYERKGTSTRSPRLLVKCGCCDNSVEIYHDEYGLEIHGVNATRQEWLKVLGPLLGIRSAGVGEEDTEAT